MEDLLNKTYSTLELDLSFGDISGISAYSIDPEVTFNDFCSGLKRKRVDNSNDDTVVNISDDSVVDASVGNLLDLSPPAGGSAPGDDTQAAPGDVQSAPGDVNLSAPGDVNLLDLTPPVNLTAPGEVILTPPGEVTLSPPKSLEVMSTPATAKTRHSYTILEKQVILKKLDVNNGNLYKTAKEAGIGRSTLQGNYK